MAKLKIFCLILVFAGIGAAHWGGPYVGNPKIGWYFDPYAGYYWWWDNEIDPYGGNLGDVPPSPFYWARFPDPGPLPLVTIVDIHNLPSINEPGFNSADEPSTWTLVDSIWYYGKWYKPGDKLYISPDGWVSFEQSTAAPNPSTKFPFDDNKPGIIAPYWTDLNALDPAPVNPGDPATVYYKYYPTVKQLVVEWFKVTQGTNWFTFGIVLQFGGKALVQEKPGCGVLWSGHFITCIYRNTNAIWRTPASWLVGIEDQTEVYGLTVDGPSSSPYAYIVNNDRIVRFGYGRIFRYNVEAYEILSPGKTVPGNTKIEPKVVIHNNGMEIVSTPLTFRIDSVGSGTVYGPENTSAFNLYPNVLDTITFPIWDKPGGTGAHYRVFLFTNWDQDECRGDDTLIEDLWVVGIGETKSELPKQFELSAVTPNPFSSTVKIRIEYTGSSSEGNTLKIYDPAGRLVKSFYLTNHHLPITTVVWDGKDDRGQKVNAGIYFIRFETPKYQKTQKVILCK